MEKQADRIRDHVRQKYIEPARRRGESEVRVRAGDVRQQMRLDNNQAPAVCGALKARKFQQTNHLHLAKLEGPPKKMANTVVFTFRLLNNEPEAASGLVEAFERVRGIAKEAFRRLGGGEAFIKREREHFYDKELPS